MNALTILAGQIEVPVTRTGRERDAHIERCAAAIRQRIRNDPVDLVVLPELSHIDYSREAFDRLERLAEPIDGPSFLIYRELAVRFATTFVYGIARAADRGYAISQVVLAPDGAVAGCYDKLHIAQFGASMEKDYFTPGERLLVFELNGFRIAPLICYDIRFPDLSRALALQHGVDLIVHCGAFSRDESFASWHAFAMTRAMENQCFVLSLNRAGADFGDSLLCPPWIAPGAPVDAFHPRDEEFRTLTVDRGRIDDARSRYPFLRDRLGDYGALDCEVVSIAG